MRLSLGWRGVLSAWALVSILALIGFGAMAIAPSFDVARAGPQLQGARIPQFDPFDLGPPAFNEEADFDAEARFAK